MARPQKHIIDYFPHYTKGGRTIFILESKFGNEGYAFWFKLLEVLGNSEGLFYDCSSAPNWEYFLAKTRVSSEVAEDIIKTLINLGKIDAELWENHHIIWIENLAKNVSDVYRKRGNPVPSKPSFCDRNIGFCENNHSFRDRNPENEEFLQQKCDKTKQSKTKQSKTKQSKEDKEISPNGDTKKSAQLFSSPSTAKINYVKIVELWNSICTSLPKIQKLSESRKQKIKLRCQEWGETPEEQLSVAEEIFRKIQASKFLRGENRNGWQATFDWVFVNSTNSSKIIEGNYDNDRRERAMNGGKPKIPLGPGEWIEADGRRTYGYGTATIPIDAPPRPSEAWCWDAASQKWLLE